MAAKFLRRFSTRVSLVRSTGWFAVFAAAMMIAGTASAESTDVSSDVRAMAKLLAGTAANELNQSCSTESSTQQLRAPMYAQIGGSGAIANLGGPGGLWLQCRLPYSNGRPGGDCQGKHDMFWTVHNGGSDLKVTARLMGLDVNGNLIDGFDGIKQGESVQMNSRLDPTDWKVKKGKGTYDIFAPVPLLKVTAESNGEVAEAYCTSLPWLDVLQPSGGVVSAGNDGASVAFKAAVPRNDPTKLELKLDGVDVLPLISAVEGGLQNCTYLTPCNGSLVAPAVTYKNLIIDVANKVGDFAANTISGSFEDLSCGGHVIRVNGDAQLDFRRTSLQCNLDDLTDKGTASLFSVDVTHIGGLPVVPGLITSQMPTDVDGMICAGAKIVSADVNGLNLPNLNAQVVLDKGFTPEGDHIGLQVTLPIDVSLAQTDLRADLDGDTTAQGTFHPGSNRVLASATENSKGANAYDTHIFAVGNNIKALGVDPSALQPALVSTQALSAVVNDKVQAALQARMDQVMNGPVSTTVQNAFILGLSAEGAQTVINSICVDPLPGSGGKNLAQIFKETVEDLLGDFTIDNPLTTFNFDPPCSCDATVKVFVEAIEVTEDFACPLVFEDGQIKATLELPDVRVTVRAKSPQNDCVVFLPPVPPLFLPIPLPSSTEVNGFVKLGLNDITFSYTLNADNLFNNTTTVGPNPFAVGGEVELAAGGAFADNAAVEFGFGGDVCNFLLEAFVFVLTGGQIDIGPLLNLEIDISTKVNLTELLLPTKGGQEAIPLPKVRVQEQVNGIYHQKLSGEIASPLDITITGKNGAPCTPNSENCDGAGVTIGLAGTFATTKVDLDVEGNPGVEIREAALPTMTQMHDQGGLDVTVGLSADAINMFFASLAGGGDMKVPDSDAQGCFVGLNVGQVLPANCDTLTIPGVTGLGLEAVATIRGICHGIRRNDCDALTMADPVINDPDGDLSGLLTGTLRGVCHGTKPDGPANAPTDTGCLFVATDNFDLVEVGTCLAAEFLGVQTISTASNVMFCAKGDIPVMSLPINPGISGVVSDLAINDISVSLVVDRDGDGMDGAINSLPGCFSGLETNKDCNIAAACLDLNFRFAVQNSNKCAAGQSGFEFGVVSALPIVRDVGKVCSSSTPPPANKEQVVNEQAGNKDTLGEPLARQSGAFSPPICGAGLDMGGFVTACATAKALGIDAGADPKFKEFLALTCDLQ